MRGYDVAILEDCCGDRDLEQETVTKYEFENGSKIWKRSIYKKSNKNHYPANN